MHSSVLIVLSIVLVFWSTYTFSFPFNGGCDSCGKECNYACGTRGFRACCLNYLKKRSTPVFAGSELRLELMMVLPELAQYYPSLKNLVPESSIDKESMKALPQSSSQSDNSKYLKPE